MKRIETETGYDGLKLESRAEVGALEGVIGEWLEDHPDDEKAPLVEEVAHILEVMWYEW